MAEHEGRARLAGPGRRPLAARAGLVLAALMMLAGGGFQPAHSLPRWRTGDGPQAGSAGASGSPAAPGQDILAQAAGSSEGPQPGSRSAEAPIEALVERVKAAAALVASKGEAVFPDFRVRGGRWFRGEDYIVVLSSDGRSVVYPPDQRGEGLNYGAFQDLGGKPFGRQILEVASSEHGHGWVHYQWRRPISGERRPVWKATYVERVQAPSGRSYLVLSGVYEPAMARRFVVDAVDGAAALLGRQGRQAFGLLRDQRGPFFYQDTYVFVVDQGGTLLVNPGFPALEGRNLLRWPDPAERARAEASLKEVLARGSTWTSYRWPRPTASPLLEAKSTYLRRVTAPGGEVLIVGSGLYEEP